MKALLLSAVCLVITSFTLYGQPTWSQDIAPIVYQNCATCHVQGGIGPFPLITYEQASSMSQAITHAVEEGEMPPFPADVSYRRYAHERVLSDDEIATIVSWVEGGSPQGDPSLAPDPPMPDVGPRIKEPDLVVTMPEYTSTARTRDEYRCFSMQVNNDRDRVLDYLEVVPGNPGIVHHVLVYTDTSSVTGQLQDQDPEPGYVGFGGVGSNTAQLIAAYVPGIEPTRYPSGFGLPLPKGARVIFQVHYPEGSEGETDRTQLRATFSDDPDPRIVSIDAILHPFNMTDGPLVIPANRVATFHQRYQVPIDVSLISVIPHMHLLGKSTKVWADPPTGEEIPLISIPQWDFHWQMVYTFKTLQRLPRGSTVQSEVVYDNTSNNPENPSDPPKTVRWGEETTDEMILTYAAWVPYQKGDEEIRLDDVATSVNEESKTSQLQIGPNPAQTYTVVRCTVNGPGSVLRVINGKGATVRTLQVGTEAGRVTLPIDTAELPSGRYTVVVESGGQITSNALIVAH